MTDLEKLSDAAYDEHYVLDNRLVLEWYPHRVNLLAGGSSMLELGLGHGYSTAFFAKQYSRYVVLEGSPQMIERFQTHFDIENIEIMNTLFEEFDTQETFDNIMMGFVLEHVDDPEIIIKRFSKFLKPGGSIFITVPNSESLHRRIGHAAGLLADTKLLSKADHDFGHLRFFDLQSLERLVDSCCMEIAVAEGVLLKPFTTDQIISLDLSEEILQSMLKVGVDYPELCNVILLQINSKE